MEKVEMRVENEDERWLEREKAKRERGDGVKRESVSAAARASAISSRRSGPAASLLSIGTFGIGM